MILLLKKFMSLQCIQIIRLRFFQNFLRFFFLKYGPIPNVSLILVYPQITVKTNKHFIRAHEILFRFFIYYYTLRFFKITYFIDQIDIGEMSISKSLKIKKNFF
jgi:hypothetical protein